MPVPEYRRFIAYFYEYIDGKKRKNAGFAKVELRNGMWRVLFRLTTDVQPEPPMQVYGFVRTNGYLLGVPMGTIRSGREIAEEWAYQAESPIGKSAYRLEDLSGIRVISGDERCFLTVWDDEPVQPERFVLKLPEEAAVSESIAQEMGEKTAVSEYTAQEMGEKAAVSEYTARKTSVEETADESPVREQAEKTVLEQEPVQEVGEMVSNEETAEPAEENVSEQKTGEMISAEQNEENAEEIVSEQEIVREAAAAVPDEQMIRNTEKKQSRSDCGGKNRESIEEVFKMRSHFQPFADTEITNCVMIMPCDIIRLQQEHWQVGRSSFLQHGFYQHRHLLLGTMSGGQYVIGVPGIRNPQEQYMAEMFGFDRFKISRTCECGKVFGYWCRALKKAP